MKILRIESRESELQTLLVQGLFIRTNVDVPPLLLTAVSIISGKPSEDTSAIYNLPGMWTGSAEKSPSI